MTGSGSLEVSPSASSTRVAVAAQAAANATVAKLPVPSMSRVYIAAPVASELQERSRTTSSVYGSLEMSPSARSTSMAVAAQAAANATVAKLQVPSMYSSVYIPAPVASELQERSRTTSSVCIAASEPEGPSRTFSNSTGALARVKFAPLLRLVPPSLYLSVDYRLLTHLSPD